MSCECSLDTTLPYSPLRFQSDQHINMSIFPIKKRPCCVFSTRSHIVCRTRLSKSLSISKQKNTAPSNEILRSSREFLCGAKKNKKVTPLKKMSKSRRASRGHEAARSEKLLRLLSDRAQTLHNDRTFYSKQSYRFCFFILTVFGGEMTSQC